MFPFLEFTVAAKLMSSAFELYVTHRQHRRYAPHHKPSPRISAIIPPAKFSEAQTYCRAKSTFQLIMGAIEAVLEAVLLLTYFAPRIWLFSARFSRGSELRQTLVFSLIYSLVGMVLDLPASLYNTFVLETRFGFNRTTFRVYVTDLLKQVLLSVVLGAPLLTALYYVLRYFSAYSPISVALGLFSILAAFLIFMMILYPSVIAPMFNQFTPLPDGQLRGKLVALAEKLKFPLDKMYVIDGSRRSSHSNAFVFGILKKYICIYDSLLEDTRGNDDLVIAVACHEMGHWHHSHTVRGLVMALVQLFLTCLLYAVTAGNESLFDSFGYLHERPLVIGLLLLNEVMSPLNELLSALSNYMSRRWEYQADAFAKGQGMAQELGNALVAMSISNLSNMSPDSLYSTWNYSHPTLLERLDALDVSPSAPQNVSKKED